MLNKLFNSKNKYYLELDEVKDSKPVQAVVQTANKVAEVVKEKTADVVETKPVQEAIKTKNEVTNTAQEKLQSATDTKAKPKEQTATKPAPAPKNSGASSYDPPFWVAAMYKNNSSGSSNNGRGEQTFATDNLMPTVTQYRRRPGPSLNKFKDMARQSRTPRI
ncbi:MAG: hypothetical protein ACRC2S_02265 [Waterburya sp.]